MRQHLLHSSLGLTHCFTDTGDWPSLTALSLSVFYSIHGNDWSGHPDQTRVQSPDQTRVSNCFGLKFQNLSVLYWQMYLCVWCLWQNVFVPNFKMYLSQVTNLFLRLQIYFVSNCQILLHWTVLFGLLFSLVPTMGGTSTVKIWRNVESWNTNLEGWAHQIWFEFATNKYWSQNQPNPKAWKISWS